MDIAGAKGSLPRSAIVLMSLASVVVILAGMRAGSDVIAPVFLALVLSIALSPLREMLVAWRMPGWVATGTVLAVVFAALVALGWVFFLMVTRLAEILPQYQSEFSTTVTNVAEALGRAGLTADAVDAIQSSIEFEQVTGALLQLLSGAASLLSNLVFLVSLLLFMGLDSGGFVRGFRGLGGEYATVSSSMQRFVRGTRKYLVVATVFGAIVAAVDVILLYALGIPLPWLWGMLAFITNFIPNIGFVIGLIPPALLALLEGGPTRMIVLVAAYSVVNVLIQTVIQPRVAGNAVGLSGTASFLSLVLWTWILGPVGAVLAVPMSLLVISVLVGGDDSRSRWASVFYAPG